MNVDPDTFLARFVTCPLCRRDNVRLRYLTGSVVIDEHPMGDILIGAYCTPVTPDAARSQDTSSPFQLDLSYARVRCPASLAPLMPRKDT